MFGEWFIPLSGGVENIVLLSVAVDGLQPTRDNCLGISLQKIVPDASLYTFYVAGANASKAYEYTHVSPTQYTKECRSSVRVFQDLETIIPKNAVIVTYSVSSYTRPWLIKTFPGFVKGRQFLDVIDCMWVLENVQEIPHTVNSLAAFDSFAFTERNNRERMYGYDMNSIYGRCCAGEETIEDNVPLQEVRISQLETILQTILMR